MRGAAETAVMMTALIVGIGRTSGVADARHSGSLRAPRTVPILRAGQPRMVGPTAPDGCGPRTSLVATGAGAV
jgi:hypothetical protein